VTVIKPSPGFRFICQQPEGGQRTEVRVHVNAGMDELVEAFRAFALAAGYNVETVNDYLGDPP
jgi:hypothetical protein